MYKSIKERGRAASDYYAGRSEYFYLTPASLSLLNGLLPLVEEHCRGRVLDAGAGRGAYRDILLRYADSYVGLDVGKSNAASVIGDVQRLPIADASIDTVFCSQVLEHVPEPWLALAEFRRVLKPGGALILSVPHISWLHNEPYDFYRYTRHGLNHLCLRAGFLTPRITAAGGLLSLLGHIGSTLLINLTFRVPLLHSVIRWLNRLCVICVVWLDAKAEKQKVFALNYVCSARKDHYLYGEVDDSQGDPNGR